MKKWAYDPINSFFNPQHQLLFWGNEKFNNESNWSERNGCHA